MTSNRPDAAPGSDQMFVMGTPCSGPTIPGDDVKFGAIRTQRRAYCRNSRSRAADGPAGNAQLPETLRERRRRRAERHSPLALPQRPAAMRVGQRALSTGVRVLLRKRPAANQPVTERCFELREGGCGPAAAVRRRPAQRSGHALLSHVVPERRPVPSLPVQREHGRRLHAAMYATESLNPRPADP